MLSMFFGRTDLVLGASKATYCEELDFDTRFDVAPQDPAKNTKAQISETGKIRKKSLGFEKSNVGDRLKCVLPKFEVCTASV